jgi:hypothetical protein
MPPPEKFPLPQEEPPDEADPPISDLPEDPETNPKAIDVDDAQIQSSKDDAFKKP